MSTLRYLPCLLLMAATATAGCAAQRQNPSFAVTKSQARAAMREMRSHRVPLQRPLVILGGFSDPGLGSHTLRSTMRKLFDDGKGRRIVGVNFTGTGSFAECRRRVIAAVNEAFPSDDPHQTVEVDVIGLSMGGLVARVAADVDVPGQARLRVARLFTISSPLRGAKLARFPLVLTTMHRDMRAGSALLERLNAREPPYEMYSYTRLRDRTVGEEYAAPDGRVAWWLDSAALESAHFTAALDPRILADIARRLRGETPFTTAPPAPLPVAGNHVKR